eukprot:979504_1
MSSVCVQSSIQLSFRSICTPHIASIHVRQSRYFVLHKGSCNICTNTYTATRSAHINRFITEVNTNPIFCGNIIPITTNVCVNLFKILCGVSVFIPLFPSHALFQLNWLAHNHLMRANCADIARVVGLEYCTGCWP